MARRLTFLLTDRTAWKLLVRTALALGALLLWRYLDFSFWAFLVAAAIFFSIYLSETPERKTLRRTFLVLSVLGFAGSGVLAGAPVALFWIFAGLWTVACFAALGVIDLLFPDRRLVYGVLNTLVFFLVFFVIFYFGRTGSFWLLGAILYFASVYLLGEVLSVLDVGESRRALVYAGASGLMLLEIAWILSFLPLGFWNSALFLTLILVAMRETVTSHFRGGLNLTFLLKELAIMLTLGLIVFAASNWSI